MGVLKDKMLNINQQCTLAVKKAMVSSAALDKVLPADGGR